MKLVFLHGRAQEDRDPLRLRQHWVSALLDGLGAAGLELPIDEKDIIFPYYGDALRDATSEDPNSLALVRYPLREKPSNGEEVFDHDYFRCKVLLDCLEHVGVTDEVLKAAEHDDDPAVQAEPEQDEDTTLFDRLTTSLTSEWIQRGLSLLDRHVPAASVRTMEATAADVTMYLQNPVIQSHIESGVAQAFSECGAEETVVIGHSLGSIVAYRMLRRGGLIECPVKALFTIGSPLGIRAIRESLEPIGHPPAVGGWFNAYDERDVVALNPLDRKNFPVEPSIQNFGGVDNLSPNHHSIRGYLSDPIVSRWIEKELRAQ